MGTQSTVRLHSASNPSTGKHSGQAGYTFNLSRGKQISESHDSLGCTVRCKHTERPTEHGMVVWHMSVTPAPRRPKEDNGNFYPSLRVTLSQNQTRKSVQEAQVRVVFVT